MHFSHTHPTARFASNKTNPIASFRTGRERQNRIAQIRGRSNNFKPFGDKEGCQVNYDNHFNGHIGG